MDVPAPVRSEEAEEAVRAAAPSRLRLGAPVPIASTDASSSAHSASTSRYAASSAPRAGDPRAARRRCASMEESSARFPRSESAGVRGAPPPSVLNIRPGEPKPVSPDAETALVGDAAAPRSRSSDGRGTGLGACHPAEAPKPVPPPNLDKELPESDGDDTETFCRTLAFQSQAVGAAFSFLASKDENSFEIKLVPAFGLRDFIPPISGVPRAASACATAPRHPSSTLARRASFPKRAAIAFLARRAEDRNARSFQASKTRLALRRSSTRRISSPRRAVRRRASTTSARHRETRRARKSLLRRS